MAMRDQIQYWWRLSAPFAGAAALVAVAVVLILFAPARGAAVALGIIAGGLLAYALRARARDTVQIAVLWSFIAVTADAAYARLSDMAPVTLAGALIKIVDAFLKLADPWIRGIGLGGGDPRAKVDAVAPDFAWALILTFIVAMVLSGMSGRRR
jgi:hypothetical protein